MSIRYSQIKTAHVMNPLEVGEKFLIRKGIVEIALSGR